MQAELLGTGILPRTRALWQGMVCPKCNACSSRREWSHWRCTTKDCGFTYSVPVNIVSAREIMDNVHFIYTGHALPLDKFRPPVMQAIKLTSNYRIHTYTIPNAGTVTHFMANDVINSRKGGPDDMFMELQKVDIGLQRVRTTAGSE